MTKCNINIYDREVETKQRTKPTFKINSEKIVKYSINRVVCLLLPTVTLLLNSREMDRNNRVDPLYRSFVWSQRFNVAFVLISIAAHIHSIFLNHFPIEISSSLEFPLQFINERLILN